MNRNLFNYFSFQFFAQVINVLFPLIALPSLVRAFGIEEFGAYALAISLSTVLCVVVEFGFNLGGLLLSSGRYNSRSRMLRLFSNVQFAKFIIAITIGLFLGLFISLTGRNLVLYIAAFYGLAINSLSPFWVLHVARRFDVIFYGTLILRLGGLFSLFVSVKVFGAIIWFLLGIAFFNTIISGALNFRVWRYFGGKWHFSMLSFRYTKVLLLQSINKFVISFAPTLYSSLLIIYGARFLDGSQLGTIMLADRVTNLIKAVISPFLAVVFALRSRDNADTIKLKFNISIKQIYLLLLAGICTFYFAFYFIGGAVFVEVFQLKNNEVISIIMIFSLVPISVIITNYFGILGLYEQNIANNLAWIMVIVGGLGFLSAYFILPLNKPLLSLAFIVSACFLLVALLSILSAQIEKLRRGL